MIERGKIASIDISNIERNTLSHNKNVDPLSESYLTRIDDTTHEDFREILFAMDDK